MSNEEIIKEVEARVQGKLKGKVEPDMLGYIHIFEARKKEILKKEYGIEFKTLRERNTNCRFD